MYVLFELCVTKKNYRPVYTKVPHANQSQYFFILDTLPAGCEAGVTTFSKTIYDTLTNEKNPEFKYYFDCGKADVDSIRQALHQCYKIPKNQFKKMIAKLRAETHNDTDWGHVLLFKYHLANTMKEQKPVSDHFFELAEMKEAPITHRLSLFRAPKKNNRDNLQADQVELLNDTIISAIDYQELYRQFVKNNDCDALIAHLPIVSVAKRKEIITILLKAFLPSRYNGNIARTEGGNFCYEDKSQYARRCLGEPARGQSYFITIAPYLSDKAKLAFINHFLNLNDLAGIHCDIMLAFSNFKDANRPAIIEKMLGRIARRMVNDRYYLIDSERDIFKKLVIEIGIEQDLFNFFAAKAIMVDDKYGQNNSEDRQKIICALPVKQRINTIDIQIILTDYYRHRINPLLLDTTTQGKVIDALHQRLLEINNTIDEDPRSIAYVFDKVEHRWLLDPLFHFADTIIALGRADEFVMPLKIAFTLCNKFDQDCISRLIQKLCAKVNDIQYFKDIAEVAKSRSELWLLIQCAKRIADSAFTQETIKFIRKKLGELSHYGLEKYFEITDQLISLESGSTAIDFYKPYEASQVIAKEPDLVTALNKIITVANSNEDVIARRGENKKTFYSYYKKSLKILVARSKEADESFKANIANALLDEKLPLINNTRFDIYPYEEIEKITDCAPILTPEKITSFVLKLLDLYMNRPRKIEIDDPINIVSATRSAIEKYVEESKAIADALQALLSQLIQSGNLDEAKPHIYGSIATIVKDKKIDFVYRKHMIDILVTLHMKVKEAQSLTQEIKRAPCHSPQLL